MSSIRNLEKISFFFILNFVNVVLFVVEYSRFFFEYSFMFDNVNVCVLINELYVLISNKICCQLLFCVVLYSFVVENNLECGFL